MKLPAGQRSLELLAQLADVDVHRAVGLAVGLAPHDPVQLLAADDAVLALRERRQQLQLAHGQGERLAVDQRMNSSGPDLEVADVEVSLPLVAASMAGDCSSYVRNVRYLRVDRAVKKL